MTIWKTADSRTKLGVAIYNFQEHDDHHLKLDIGDTVHILEEAEGWFRGYATKNKSKKGIFPRNYISLKEATVHVSGPQETIKSKEHPLVIELSNVVREWHAIWKQMFVENKKQELEKVQKMIGELIEWRKKIIARIFTVDEMKGVQHTVTSLIDQGNAMLKLDLVVRDEHGNLLNPEQASVIEIYRRHIEAAERIHKEIHKRDSDIDTKPSNWPSSFNLFVMFRNFVCKIGEDSDIMMNLFDAKEERFISENYLVQWSKNGAPKDIDMLNNFRVVFTDLGSKDRQRESVYLVYQIIRIGVMDPKYADNKKQTQGIRRPFGVGVMDISEIMRGTKKSSEENQHFIPFLQCGEKEFMYNVIKKAISAKDINHRGQGIWVSFRDLPGDMKQVRESHPHLVLAGTAMARKMGFPDVIMPGDVRNDIYLTLQHGEFSKGPTKTSDKNVEITMVVCNSQGKVLKDVIRQGCSDPKMSEYKTIVYYHEDKPKWHETTKIAISTDEEFKDLHIKFLYRHKSSQEAKDRNEKYYAMSFIRLLNSNGTTLEDKVHELLVYKIENRRNDDVSYINLPCTKNELDAQGGMANNKQANNFILSHKDSFFVDTFVCSTKLTHNVDLLGLLKWHEKLGDTQALKCHLKELMRGEGEEIVKFLQDLLDSLFNIFMQNTKSELCENLVFDALVYIIGLISEKKYSQFRPVLDAYIDSAFSFPTAYNKLIIILKEYVEKANEKTPQNETLLPAIKSLEYIFKFIIRSRCLFSLIHDGRGKQQFEITLKQLITSISDMMVYRTDHTLLVQGAALKYMPAVIGDVMTVFDPVELSHLLVQFINNVPQERLTKQKMKCLDAIIQTDLFTLPQCRCVLLPAFLSHTHILMESNSEMEDCVSVLSNTLIRLWSCHTSRDADIHTLMRSMLRTVIQSVINMDQSMKQVRFFGEKAECIEVPSETRIEEKKKRNGNCVAVMVSMLRQMTDSHYKAYIQSFETPFDLIDFLMEILCVFKDLVNRKVYPSDWLEMLMIQNCVILRALRFFAGTIYENFSNPFDQHAKELWSNFFLCAITFLTQDALQLHNFSQSKRSKIISRYKDMRRETGFEIRAMWFKLGANKIKFIPELVGEFLEMTLIPEIELRKATIPIFHDMMQHEFMQQGNFNEFENEMITKLDSLIEGGRGDEQYMILFKDIMTQLCQSNPTMCDQSFEFVSTIHDLLERLMVYRTIMLDDVHEHGMSCIVNLLDFYHDTNRPEMYIRYLHKLADLHLECDNHTEAGYTFLLYAKLLEWSNKPLSPMLANPIYPQHKTHEELKEQLYYDIISQFQKGKMWEKGIEMCEELCQLYKEELFDYEKLSQCLKRQANLYDSILSIQEMRPEPEYFRVGYFGQGFPSFLQNKVFIYRGKSFQRLADFNARMLTLFPRAELMQTLDPPTDDLLNSPKQFLQINAVTPVMELKDCFLGRNINEQILKYYRVNEVQQFTFSRPFSGEGSNDVTKMWLERTYLKTLYTFPGIVGWYPVVDVDTVKVSPIQIAIETMVEKNKKIETTINKIRQDSKLGINDLSMQLNGVCRPDVMGGIANYKEFYTSDDFDPDLQERLREATIEQMSIVRDGLILHKSKAPQDLQGLQQVMEEGFSNLCTDIEKEYGIKVADKVFTNTTLRRNQSLPCNNMYPNRSSDGSSVQSFHLNPEAPLSSSSQSLYTPKNNAASRSQSVFVKDRSASISIGGSSSKVSLQSKVSHTFKKRVSQVSEQLADLSHRNSVDSPPIELSEQLTPKRPPRPDQERRSNSRPPSAQMKLESMKEKSGSVSSLASSRSGNTITSSRHSDASLTDFEQPPPLPQKKAHIDSISQGSAEVRPDIDKGRRASSVSQAGNKQKPPPPPPPPTLEEDDIPPELPPKPSH